MSWYNACCPPHLANFRETVAAAAAEAAAASKAAMHSATAAAGGLPPSFVMVRVLYVSCA